MPQKYLENMGILCFERRFSKQNSVIRLKLNILVPKKFLGWLGHWCNVQILLILSRLLTM